jgi:hypothetical protein
LSDVQKLLHLAEMLIATLWSNVAIENHQEIMVFKGKTSINDGF